MASVSNIGAPTNFTIKFWFKTTHLPLDSDVELLSFPGSIRCRFSQREVLVCDSQDRQTISVKSNKFSNGQWYYFTLSVRSNGAAQLAVFDKSGSITSNTAQGFFFIQTVPSGWGLCLGYCVQSSMVQSGFQGGIREVVGMNQYQNLQAAQESANQKHYYSNQIKGYYRFSGQKMFYLEEFREITVTLNSSSNGFAFDIIPNDICPATFNTRSWVVFDQLQKINSASIGKSLKQNNYAYTMSLTFNVNSTTCFTPNYQIAQQNCSIVLVNQVFMLFFSAPNQARFHFYADKDYYDSQSSSFFVPFNQQITIQMQLSQFGGYQIAVLDQYSNVLQNWSKQQNMQVMRPQNRIELFSGFEGTVNRFLLTDQAFYLPKSYGQLSGPIIDISLKSVQTQVIQNMGSGQNQLQLRYPPSFVLLPDIQSEYGQKITPYPKFDGIACDDQHQTLNLRTVNSKFQFTTPAMSDWMSETTIQFWFKMQEWGPVSINGNEVRTILNMQSDSQFVSYWYIFAKSGGLVVAPFGFRVPTEPIVTFQEFNQLNADNLGWWHLSCYYQFNNQLQCTLHNQNLEITKSTDMRNLQTFFMPKDSLTAIFGKSEDKLNNGAPMLLKEVRYWNRIIPLKELQQTRYLQIDPTKSINLISYFRLGSQNPVPVNFAYFNPNYSFNKSQASFQGVNWQSDFYLDQTTVYDNSSMSLVQASNKQYLNICPLQTYRKPNGDCYSSPVYQAQITVFPKWNDASNQLEWHLSVVNSKLGINNVLSQIDVQWSTNDEVLNLILNNPANRKPYNQVLPSNILRQENNYKIRGTLTNSKNTFSEYDQIDFIPNQCHWFEIGNRDSFNGYQEISVLPGSKDINFQVVLVKNQVLDCSNLVFFDTFKNIDFKFIIDNTESTYFIDAPNVTYTLQSPSSQNPNDTTGIAQANDLIINIIIPADEQYKIPVWTHVKILMTIDWTVGKYENQLTVSSKTFQNAMYTIQFAPVGMYLIPSLEQNLQFVQRNQTFILDASKSTVSRLSPSQVSQNLTFEWICPDDLLILCKGQRGSTFYVPWNSLSRVNLQWATTYLFGVQVTWHKPDGTNETRTQQVSILWFNIAQPVFTIQNSPSQMLVTGRQQSVFTIKGQNFNSSGDMSAYQINWSITPNILNQTAQSFINKGQTMIIQPGQWQPNTNYNITVQIVFTSEPDINGLASYLFNTTAPPQNGIISISPSYGYIGDNFTVNVTQFSGSQSVFYSVFNTFDSQGLILGSQINTKSVPQGLPFVFRASTPFPIIIQVYDLKGESITQMLAPFIVQRPDPNCTTTVVCTQNTNQTRPSNSTNATKPQNSTNLTSRNSGSSQRLQRLSAQTNSTVTNTTSNGTCRYTTVCIPVYFNFENYTSLNTTIQLSSPTNNQNNSQEMNQTANQTSNETNNQNQQNQTGSNSQSVIDQNSSTQQNQTSNSNQSTNETNNQNQQNQTGSNNQSVIDQNSSTQQNQTSNLNQSTNEQNNSNQQNQTSSTNQSSNLQDDQNQQNQTSTNNQSVADQNSQNQQNQTSSTNQSTIGQSGLNEQGQTSNTTQPTPTTNSTDINQPSQPTQNDTNTDSPQTNQTNQDNNISQSNDTTLVDLNNTTQMQNSTNSSNRLLQQSSISQLIDSQFDSDQDLCSQLSLALIQTSEINKIELAFDAYDKFGFICILDLINLQAIIDQLPDVQTRIISELKELPVSTIYQSKQIQITSQVFNKQLAIHQQQYTLQLLGAQYTLDTESLFWQFPQQPNQDFYMQGISLIGMEGETNVILRIIDSVTGQSYDLSDLDGRADLVFAIQESSYKSGQTVCQGMLENGSWNSEICLTEIDVEKEIAKCMCSMTLGVSMISFKNDLTKQVGKSVSFPVHKYITQFQGTSYFFIAIITAISLFGFIGSLIVWKIEKNDWEQIAKLDGWKLDLVKSLAQSSEESIELVKLRQSDIGLETTLITLISKTHPLFSPFTQFMATQTRICRFLVYQLQINAYVIGCMLYFGQSYRQDDPLRQELFLDFADVQAIQKAGIIGSFILLPIISMPINYLLSNKLQASGSNVQIIQQRVFLRTTFNLLSLIVNFVIILLAVWVCLTTHTTNQYILASTIFTGIFIATFGSNVLLSSVITNITCAPSYVKQLIKDASTVKQLKHSTDNKDAEPNNVDLSERCTLKSSEIELNHKVFCIEEQTSNI